MGNKTRSLTSTGQYATHTGDQPRLDGPALVIRSRGCSGRGSGSAKPALLVQPLSGSKYVIKTPSVDFGPFRVSYAVARLHRLAHQVTCELGNKQS